MKIIISYPLTLQKEKLQVAKFSVVHFCGFHPTSTKGKVGILGGVVLKNKIDLGEEKAETRVFCGEDWVMGWGYQDTREAFLYCLQGIILLSMIKGYVLISSGHVLMWELDCKES